MTDCTDRHAAAPGDGVAGEGQEGMADGTAVTDYTERHAAVPGDGVAGQEGMAEMAQQ